MACLLWGAGPAYLAPLNLALLALTLLPRSPSSPMDRTLSVFSPSAALVL